MSADSPLAESAAICPNTDQAALRIVCIGETWLGSNSRAAFMGFRRRGHSIQVIDEHQFSGAIWRSFPARVIRRLLRPLLAREFYLEARRLAETFRPQGLFVFKGNLVHPGVVRFYRQRNIPAVNVYPDVSFRAHGAYIPRTLPLYSHVFTTKSWGVADMQQQLGIRSVSFLEHGFDPEIHRPLRLTTEDRERYGCDVVFIGTWSPKKERLLAQLKRTLPTVRLKVWGCQWEKSTSPELAGSVVGDGIVGEEYSKVLQAASICLGS